MHFLFGMIVTTFERSFRICHQEGLQSNREGLKGMRHVSCWALLIILIYWAKIKRYEEKHGRFIDL